MVSDPALISEFVTESLEHLERAEPLLLEMEKRGTGESAAVNEIFRAIHSIKGAAGFLGLANISALSHALESLLMRLRDGEFDFQPAMADPLLRGIDALRRMLGSLPQGEGEPADALCAALTALVERGSATHSIGAEAMTDPFQQACAEQRRKGKHVVRIALPQKRRERERLLTALGRYGERVEEAGEKKSVVFASPLELDLLAEAIGLPAESLSVVRAPVDGAVDEFPLPDDARPLPLYFGQIAVDLGFLNDEQRREVLRAQRGSLLRRSFSATAIALGILTVEQAEAIAAAQAQRLADAELPAHPFEEEERPEAVRPSEGADALDEQISGAERRAETIRVSLTLLDKLMNLAGELVLGRNQMRQLLESSTQPGVKSVLQNLDLVTTEMQENIMNTRMQPIRVLFDRMPRLVRDIAHRLGKRVELEVTGGDVELDRSIIEALADPMTHMLRNAVDHGLEDPKGRTVLGKSEVGRVAVRAYHERGRVVIEVQDDGRGIDPERVKEAAVQRGAITRDQAQALSEKDAVALIFQPGLSTATEISDVSGRGVGMDVVRTNIQSLGGQIEVSSAIGEGTRLRIHLPLTLAIIPSLIVSVEGERFAIPQLNVVEVVRLKREAEQVERIRSSEVLRLRGDLLPLVRLAQCLEIRRSEQSQRTRANVVILRSGAHLYGLVVDELHDSEEIVVKPVSTYLSDCGWYAGATILGDGRVAMILDALGIAKRAQIRFDEIADADPRRGEQAEPAAPAAERRSLVVFSNSADERFAMSLRELLRLERVEKPQVEWVGSRRFLKHRGRTIPLVRLEDVLPVRGGGEEADEFFVLIPRLEGLEAGIIATRIVDTLESDAQPDRSQLNAPGLAGSAIIEDRLTLFIDAPALLEAAGIERTDAS
ncbi:MAG TPA: chemotaxis protein CheA [Myxococcota bacterium]|nr:chemotaxis protein CheA [Myxococcota bacterium]